MEKRSVVSVIRCGSYAEDAVYDALKKGLESLGGLGRFVQKDQKILVKPNFLKAADPDKAIATHPAVIGQFLRILQEEGYEDVMYGDSPGHGSGEAVAKGLRLQDADTAGAGAGDLDIYGARFAKMNETVRYEFPEGSAAKEFPFCREVAEADAIINLCKMKTHALERITGAVKNVYGFICGTNKAQGHVLYPNASKFARYLGDIHNAKGPKLNIMDGIVAMEGNGPGNGDPVPMNLMLFSADPVALDTVFCWLVNLDPMLVPTNVQCSQMGVGTMDESGIDLLLDGQPVDRSQLVSRCGKPDFDVMRSASNGSLFNRSLELLGRFKRRPHIDPSRCIHCGICVEHCPVPGKAVSFKNGMDKPPVYDYKKCITCYCCQEMCPRNAIHAGRRKSL